MLKQSLDDCKKCGQSNWGIFVTKEKRRRYCRPCRQVRSEIRYDRMKRNGGYHTKKQWEELKLQHTRCPMCQIRWSQIPRRYNSRYRRTVITKDHIISIALGGTDHISNIRPLCYRCNFSKGAKNTLRFADDHPLYKLSEKLT